MMYNPRFPHSLKVMRVQKEANGEPVTDEEGIPVYDIVPLERVVMRDGIPQRRGDGSFITEMSESIPYGYRTSGKSTDDSGAVEVTDLMLATPMFLTLLDPSDIVEMTDYDRTCRCEVVRKATFNLGSNIWVKEVKG
jgi:hypothetical protein